jgi:CheY-like chemotaxis protein
MDVRPTNVNFYRYQFKDLLADRTLPRQRTSTDTSRPLIADVLISRSAANSSPPAPQGIGEMKHPVTNSATAPVIEEFTEPVEQPKEKDDTWFTDSSFKYILGSNYLKPQLSIREEIENEIRKRKKSGLPCPYTDRNNKCSMLFVRCGDRLQYGTPETQEQRNLSHSCLYRPETTGRYILIVDENKTIRDFCKNSIELFFKYDSKYIITAATGNEAIDILNRLKVEGKQCGLIICASTLPGISGYDIADELFLRNYNTEIIVSKEQGEKEKEPEKHSGNKEIIPHKTLVKKIITKPFHSSTFINALKNTEINHLFNT